MGVYCLAATFPREEVELLENCKDLNEGQFSFSTYSIRHSGDTVIFKKTENHQLVVGQDTLDSEPPYISEFYFDENGRLIQLDDYEFFSYPSKGTVNLKIIQNDGLTMVEKRITTIKNISETKYITKVKNRKSDSYLSSRTGRRVSSRWPMEVIKQEYLLNNLQMPYKITVLESDDPMEKISGSYMEITYK